MRRRILTDIKTSSLAEKNSPLINLTRQKVVRLPLRYAKFLLIPAVIISFVFGSVSAPDIGVKAAQTDQQRQDLENQLAGLEDQIAQYEATIEDYQKQGSSLQGEIKVLESQIAKLNLQIKAVNLNLSQLDNQIQDTTSQITQTESDIVTNKDNLAYALQSVYEQDKEGLIEVMLKNPKLSDFFGDLNNLLAVQDGLRVALNQIIDARQKLLDQKETLALQRQDAAALKAYQDAQKKNIASVQTEKSQLLKDTKGKEATYQTMLAATKKTAAEVRQQIFKLLGGGQLEFGEAYKLAKFAQDATGIRAALVLAVLNQESALGKNVGQCEYDVNPYYPAKASNLTTMHPTRDIPIFLALLQKLGLNPKTTLVSCPIPSDGAYGGAMGPAQFIPSTWQLYQASIAKITASNPPSPWNNGDAFVATALYLKDALNSSACQSYGNQLPSDRQTLLERCAAAKYYAGSRWYTYRWAYGEPIITKANEFEDDIAILNS